MNAFPRHFSSPATGQHFCQLHEREESLQASLLEYTLSGLRGGEAVLLIARGKRLAEIEDALAQAGMDTAERISSRMLTLVDAGEFLSRIMPGASLSRRLFLDEVEGLIGGILQTTGAPLRIYGELVDLLWHQGNLPAVLALEQYWNELASYHPFSLYCGYHLPGLDPASYQRQLANIANCHTELMATPDDQRLQEAIDAACSDVLGLPMSSVLCYRDRSQQDGEHRLSAGRRTVFWLQRNMPAALNKVLARARMHFYGDIRRDVQPEEGNALS